METLSRAYETVLELAKALPARLVREPFVPVDVAAQEAGDLAKHAEKDKERLTAAGLVWKVVEMLVVLAHALREAESRWLNARYERDGAQREWTERSPEAYELVTTNLHHFRYAYRDRADVMRKVNTIGEGRGHADMIQDLNDIAAVGRAHPGELQAVGFDITLLDQAQAKAHEMFDLLSMARSSSGYKEAKDMRDRIYTLLKQHVDTVRECGKYVFWREPDRLAGYSSDYIRGLKKNGKSEEEEAAAEAA